MPDCWMSTPCLYSPSAYGCVLQLELFLCDWSYRKLLKNSKKKRRWMETDCFWFELIGKLPENDFFHLYLWLCHLFQCGNHLDWCTYTEEGEKNIYSDHVTKTIPPSWLKIPAKKYFAGASHLPSSWISKFIYPQSHAAFFPLPIHCYPTLFFWFSPFVNYTKACCVFLDIIYILKFDKEIRIPLFWYHWYTSPHFSSLGPLVTSCVLPVPRMFKLLEHFIKKRINIPYSVSLVRLYFLKCRLNVKLQMDSEFPKCAL